MEDVPEYTVFTGEIAKLDLDDRQYCLLKLTNGMHAVLVHDPDADKAAASVYVGVGHMQDPVSLS